MTQDNIPSAAPSLARLVHELNRLPGIGPKSAQRLAYYIIRLPEEEAYALADAVTAVKQNIVFCQNCQNLADSSPCSICSDDRRDSSIICVVEDPLDVWPWSGRGPFEASTMCCTALSRPSTGSGPTK